jgi:hypothetical protein
MEDEWYIFIVCGLCMLTVEARQATVGVAQKQTRENVPVNSAEFLSQGEASVPEHEKFLYM